MGWFSNLVGTPDASQVVAATGNALDSLFTSAEEKAQAAAVMEKIRQNPQMWQAQINMIGAQHRSIFVAGWRPAVGWVCALGLLNTFLINPWIQWYTGQRGPDLPQDIMLELVLALIGIASLRTLEKARGVSR